jgi:hypothetical protein
MLKELPPHVELAVLGLTEDLKTGYWDRQSEIDLGNLLDWVKGLIN